MVSNTAQKDNSTALSTDDKHQLLANSRRRLTLAILDEHGPMDKSELSDRIAAVESGDDHNSQERKRVYVSLHQCHIPKMAEYGVIEDRPESIRLGPNADRLLPHIDAIPKRRRAASLVRGAF